MAIARPAGTWTYADLFDLPDDGTRYEIIDGDLFELPAPLLRHAAAISGLITLIVPVIMRLGGYWFTSAVDVFFAGANPVEPDIVVVLPGSRAEFVDNGIDGPPDLLIEVLSPSNRTHDTVRKRALYARGGVREYWIVDPELQTIEIIGEDGEMAQRVAAGEGEGLSLRSPLLGELAVSADAIFPRLSEKAGR